MIAANASRTSSMLRPVGSEGAFSGAGSTVRPPEPSTSGDVISAHRPTVEARFGSDRRERGGVDARDGGQVRIGGRDGLGGIGGGGGGVGGEGPRGRGGPGRPRGPPNPPRGGGAAGC